MVIISKCQVVVSKCLVAICILGTEDGRFLGTEDYWIYRNVKKKRANNWISRKLKKKRALGHGPRTRVGLGSECHRPRPSVTDLVLRVWA